MDSYTVIFTKAIRHNGVILAFYVVEDNSTPKKTSINYRIFDPEPGLPSQVDTWDELNELDLGDDYRLVGSSVMDSFNNDESESVEFYPYLDVISEKGQIYLFRHIKNSSSSGKESITVNRLRLFYKTQQLELDENPDPKQTDESTDPTPDIEVVQELERVWEARFRNSESRTVPSDDNDTMDYKNSLGQPFYEPTLILNHLPAAKNGYFATDIFTTDNPEQGLWHFYINQNVAKDDLQGIEPHDELHIYYVQQSQDGLFDFPTPNIMAESSLKPDNEIYFKVNGQQSCMKLGVACQRYAYQEEIPKILEPNEAETKNVKRQLRQFISFGANSYESSDENTLAFFDFAVQANGKLAPLIEEKYKDHHLLPVKKSIKLQKVGIDKNGKSCLTAEIVNEGRSIAELTIMAGYFVNDQDMDSGTSSNVTPISLPVILDGSDGLLHIYFQNKENYLSAIQYDAKAKRFEYNFRLSENIENYNGSTVNIKKGELLFIMRQPGEFTKEEKPIEFYLSGNNAFEDEGDDSIQWTGREGDTINGLYSCCLRDLSGTAHYWYGIPRRLPNLADVINGNASSSPRDDQYFFSGEKTYFDGNQERLQLFVPEYIDRNADATARRTIMLSPKVPVDDINLNYTNADIQQKSFDNCNPYSTGTLKLTLCLNPWLKKSQSISDKPDYIGVEVDSQDQLVWTYGKHLYRQIEGSDDINQVLIADGYSAQCMVMSQDHDGTFWVGANNDSNSPKLIQFNLDAQYGKTLTIPNDITNKIGIETRIGTLAFDQSRQVLWASCFDDTENQVQLYKYHPQTKETKPYSNLNFGEVKAMTCDENGSLCIVCTEKGNSTIIAKIFDSDKCQSKEIKLSSAPTGSNAICSSAPGIFFIGTDDGVYCFDFSKSTKNTYKLTDSDKKETVLKANALRYDKKRDTLWIAGENTDESGDLYFATRESGAGEYKIQSVEDYMDDDTAPNPIKGSTPLALTLTQDGTPWTLTADANKVKRFRCKKDNHGTFIETWDHIPLRAKEFTKILLGRGHEPGELNRPYDYISNSRIKRVDKNGKKVSINGQFGIVSINNPQKSSYSEEGLLQGSVLYSIIPIDAEDLLQPGTYQQGDGSYVSSCPYPVYGPSRDYSVHLGQISEDACYVDLTKEEKKPKKAPVGSVIATIDPKRGEAPKFLAAPSDLHSYNIFDLNDPKILEHVEEKVEQNVNTISAEVVDDDFPVLDDLTMEMWIKPTGESSDFTNLISRGLEDKTGKQITFGIKPASMSLGFGMTKIQSSEENSDEKKYIDYVLLPSFGLPPSFTIEFWARLEEEFNFKSKRTFLSLTSRLENSPLFCINWEDKKILRIILNGKTKDFKFSGIDNYDNDLKGQNVRYRIQVVPVSENKAEIACTILREKKDKKPIKGKSDHGEEIDYGNRSYFGVNAYTASDDDSDDDGDSPAFVWCIGHDYYKSKLDDNFIGYLQELRIWAGSSNDPEDFLYYSEPLSGDEANLIAYYPLSDGPGAQYIHDASSNKYHGLPQSAKSNDETTIDYYSKAKGFLWLKKAILSNGDKSYGLYAGSNEASGMVQTIANSFSFEKWQHVAAVCRMSYALSFSGMNDKTSSYINFGHHSSLNPESGLTIAATLKLPKDEESNQDIKDYSSSQRIIILSKIGQEPEDRSYELYLTKDDRLGVTVYIDLAPNTPYYAINLETTDKIDRGKILKVTASFTLHSDIDSDIGANGINTIVSWNLELYNNNLCKAKLESSKTLNGVVRPKIKTSGADLVFGRYYNPDAESVECEFEGDLLELSLWKRGLSKIEIQNLAIFNQYHKEDIISRWPINEGSGDKVHDDIADNHGTVIYEDSDDVDCLWTNEPSKADWQILVDGKAVKTSRMNSEHANRVCDKIGKQLDADTKNPWGKSNGTLYCGRRKNNFYNGLIDEVRLWSSARTAEQIYTYAQRPMSTGYLPDDLFLYWNFDGKDISWDKKSEVWNIRNWANKDNLTGQVASLAKNQFSEAFVSSSPSSPESPFCVMALGKVVKPDYEIPELTAGPMVYEYGDLVLHDDYSISKGLMKRGYLAPTSDSSLGEETNIAVGDLDVIYVGQAQMNPTLIGFIEGPPPLPSENLTIMQPPKPDDYTGTASVELSESKDVDYSFSASRDTGFTLDFDYKIGIKYKKNLDAEKFVGFGSIGEDKFEYESLFGFKMSLSHTLSNSKSAAKNAGFHMGQSTYLENVGGFEDVDEKGIGAVPYVGRRYLPSNIGSALVKSATGNLYGLRLKDTGALVSYELVPNPDIPVDWNIIIFPINSDYTKNGTLDGMVGFTPDPDYPEAYGGNLGSYFKPQEAYRIKREIERETKQIESIYAQHEVYQGVDLEGGLPSSQKLGYDFDKSLAKKSLVNTYVWTADGGLFSEEEQYHTSKSESFGGGYSLSGKAGLYQSITFAGEGAAGLDFSFDLMFGSYLNVNATKSKSSSLAFGIKAKVVGEGFINQRDNNVNGNSQGNSAGLYPYNSKLQPGKVRGYRFLSYYLSPKPEHFEDFYNTVVDSEWLRFSNDPDAAALRQAMPHSVGVWRMLHRVTYVSRVLPDINDTKFWTKVLPSKEVWYPDSTSVSENDWVIYAVENTTNPTVSPYTPDLIAIGKAVDDLIENKLTNTLPISLSSDKKEVLRARMVFFLQRYYGIIQGNVSEARSFEVSPPSDRKRAVEFGEEIIENYTKEEIVDKAKSEVVHEVTAGQSLPITIPEHVFEISVEIAGGQGGNTDQGYKGKKQGGSGYYYKATIPVNPGDVIVATAGGQGEEGQAANGGNASSIHIGQDNDKTWLIVAGGGGGACYSANGLAATANENGVNAFDGGTGGKAGSNGKAVTGGAKGGLGTVANVVPIAGGNGKSSGNSQSGGGGGGYSGGGGGYLSGGGGGGSFCSDDANILSHEVYKDSGDGFVKVRFEVDKKDS